MIPDSLYLPLLGVVSSVGADITDECADFLEREILKFNGSEEEFLAYARAHVNEWFPICNVAPVWIQNAEWQFEEGQPMWFVGQVSLPKESGVFHDEAFVFVFIDLKGLVKTVLQVA